MNEQLEAFARKSLKEGLAKCTDMEVLLFQAMYSHRDRDKPIDQVVDDMPTDKLDWAMQQVENTLKHRGA